MNDDRFELDAQLAIRLLGWGWYLDPQWSWVGLYPPDTPEWQRWNFPANAEPVEAPGTRRLMPSWDVGGYHVGDGPERMGVPRFAADWRAMATLVDGMRLRGFRWHGSSYTTPDRPAVAVFATQTSEWRGQAETLPKAAALAALAALTAAGGSQGEVSDQTARGRLTSIRNVARRDADPVYAAWLASRNAADTVTAALQFIAEWASAALQGFNEQ